MSLEVHGFDWDEGNRAKCQKHGLSIKVIERLFARPVAVFPDSEHSRKERRFRAVGQTDGGRNVFIIFTLRSKGDEVLLRPISARYMHQKETEAYEKENPNL
jgi:uncharacterized protein